MYGVCVCIQVCVCTRARHSASGGSSTAFGLVVFAELGSLLFVLLQLVLNSGQPARELWVFLFPLPISP